MALRLRALFSGRGSGRSSFRDFSDKERKKLAESGVAMPDGSFPIQSEQDLKNAIHAIGRAKDPAAAKRHIIKRARALGKTDLIPQDWHARAGVMRGHVSGVLTVALALSADDAPPEWVEVIPAGTFTALDGRGPFFNDRPDDLVAATRELIRTHMTAGLPVDLDHASEFAAPQGNPAPAVGWIRDVEARNGAIYAKVEWTPEGADVIRAKKWKYLSPVFSFERPADAPADQLTGRVTLLENLALTNQPALAIPPLTASRGAHVAEIREKHMKLNLSGEELRQVMIAAKKGKPLHETVRDLQAALPNVHPHKILDMAKMATDPETAMDAIDGDPDGDGDEDGAMSANNPYDGESDEEMARRHAEEMASCSSEDERQEMDRKHAEEKARRERERASRRHEPASRQRSSSATRAEIDAAIAAHPLMLAAQRTISTLRGERAAEKAVAAVDAAIKAGKLLPAQRDWAVAYATSDKAGFDQFIGAQPTYIASGESMQVVPPGTAIDADALTQTEKAICAAGGYDEKDYLARKKQVAAMIRGQESATMVRLEISRKAA